MSDPHIDPELLETPAPAPSSFAQATEEIGDGLIPTSAVAAATATAGPAPVPSIEDIPVPTLEAAMSSVQSQMPAFTPYVPATGSNGRRASTSGNGKAGPSNKTGGYRSVGPELMPPSKLAAVSQGKFIPTGEPPYAPPPDVIYPPDCLPNPFAEDMSPQPILENFLPNSLYRPKYLPADIDDRLDQRSVWMGVEKDSSRAVYFLPPTCQCCKHPAVAQHCDRGWPSCARCLGRNVECIPGKAWGMMRPKGKRRNLKAEAAKNKATSEHIIDPMDGLPVQNTEPVLAPAPKRYSTAEKGKSKAVPSWPAVPPSYPVPYEHQSTTTPMDIDPLVYGPPVQKKRRLSSTVEGEVKRPRRKSTRESLGPPTDLPLTPADRAYFARVEANSLKVPLMHMNGPCPVWAKTRRALQSAAEYLREPKRTQGASVEIGVGGIARGVILEGDVSAQGVFWGRGQHAGTIMTSIGHPRKQRRDKSHSEPIQALPVDEGLCEALPLSATPPLNILPGVLQDTSKPVNAADRFWSDKSENGPPSATNEEPAVSALLMAQRARTPVGLAVSQDYAAVPFKVPRAYIVLGWFWVVDAWLEPVMPELQLFQVEQQIPSGPPERVVWEFRFEWCSGEQELPWWSSVTDLPRHPDPVVWGDANDKSWLVNVAGQSGSTTVRPASHDEQGEPVPSVDQYAHKCENCKYTSERVYADGDICLNEECSWFFGDAASTDNHIGPRRNDPSNNRPCTRILPEHIGLKLRPPEPTGKEHEAGPTHAGREYWRGWVCRKCGMAQERYKWAGWNCEACGNTLNPQRRIYTDEDLRNPSRPVYTGPRQDDGYVSWPFQVTRFVSLYPDDIKVVKHVLDPIIFGQQAEVAHALHTEPKAGEDQARAILKALQVHGTLEDVSLRRYVATPYSPRPVDASLSPFYTYLCGPDHAPPIPAFPTHKSTPWFEAPPVCVQATGLINLRAGRMFPEQSEFNSLLVAANPPGLPSSSSPKLTVEAHKYVAVMFLGSDGSVRIRPAGGRMKQGEMTLQHGDVVGIHAGQDAIEATLRLDGFGFFCIARHVSPPLEPILQPAHDVYASYGTAIGAGFEQGQETYIDTIPTDLPRPQPGPITVDPKAVIQAAFHSEEVPLFQPKTKARPRPSAPAPPPKPAKLAEPPLTDWYIGAYPLDKEQPMKILPPFRDTINGTAEDVEAKQEGEQDSAGFQGNSGSEVEAQPLKDILSDVPDPATKLDPPPLSPLPGYDDFELEPASSVVPTPTSKKATPASKVKRADVTPSSTPSRRGRGKPRASGVSTPAGSVVDPAEGTPSSRGTGTGAGGRGGSKVRGGKRGRKSGASVV